MPEFSRFEEENPLVRDIPVAKKTTGYENWGKVFGEVSGSLMQQAVSMKKEARDALFLQSQNYVSEVVKNAKVQLIQNPGMGDKILEKTKYTIDSIKETTHPKDREQLQSIINSHLGSFELEVANNNVQQNKLKVQNNLYDILPSSLEDLSNEFNPKIFDNKLKKIEDTINNAAFAQAITPQQHANFVKLLGSVHDRHEAILRMAQSENVDAKTYQSITSISYNNNSTSNAGTPINSNTALLTAHYNAEHTYQTALADSYNGIFPDPRVLSNLSDSDFKKVQFGYMGSIKGKGLVNSHEPYPIIMNRLNELESKPVKTYSEMGELNYLKSYKNSLDSGNFLSVIGGTPEGGAIAQRYIQNKSAIESTVFTGNEEESINKQKSALNANFNNYINENKSLAISSHIPFDKVNLVPTQLTDMAQDSFVVGHDTNNAINSLYTLDRSNQYWLSKAMKTPLQKEAVYSVALQRNSSSDNTPNLFSHEMIRAAQFPRDDSSLKLGENGEHESNIKYQLISNMKDILGFVGMQNQGSQEAIIQLGMNWVKDQAKVHGDFELKHSRQYIDDFIDNYQKGFKIIQGTHYQFNLNEVNFTPDQADKLSYYELEEAYQKLLSKYGYNAMQSMIDLAPLMVTNTRDGRIIVTDSKGNIVSEDYMTSSKLDYVEHKYKQTIENDTSILIGDHIGY